MSGVKFIVPDGHSGAGSVREVPENDAESFDQLGWERAEQKQSKSNKNKATTA